MPSARFRLRSTADPAMAVTRLRELIASGPNATKGAAGARGVPQMRDSFLTWTEQVENVLGDITDDHEVIAAIFTSRYWRIRQFESDWRAVSDPRPYPLVYGEVAHQVERLKLIVVDLEARLTRLALAGHGHLTVLDTHILMHFQPVKQIPWPSLLDRPRVRLIIPLRVIEEIDAKKYAKSIELAKRARDVLPTLELHIGRAGSPQQLIDAVTLEVPVLTGPRERPDDADEEILNTCLELGQFSGQPVTLVTGDTGMRLRAQAHHIDTASLPSNYLRRQPGEDTVGDR